MAINDHYMEILEVVHKCFVQIFNGLETRHAKELDVICEQYHSKPLTFTQEPCVLHWPEAQAILTEKGFTMVDGMDDLNAAQVSKLWTSFVMRRMFTLCATNCLTQHLEYTELALGESVKDKYGQITFCDPPILHYECPTLTTKDSVTHTIWSFAALASALEPSVATSPIWRRRLELKRELKLEMD